MPTLARRLHALVLLLLFLGGGTSLPAVDVLLFHLHGEGSRATAHVEPANGCASHASHCPLSQATSTSHALDTRLGGSLLASTTVHSLPSRTSLPVPTVRGVGFYSRAPPAAHA